MKELFSLWGADPADPLGGVVPPGGRVLLKPNWVLNYNSRGHSLDSLITHSSVLFYLADWSARAMRGKGEVVLADAPLQGCNFGNLLKEARVSDILQRLAARHPGVSFEAEDWRLTVMSRNGDDGRKWSSGVAQGQRTGYEDFRANDYRLVDLGCGSFLEDIAEFSNRFRVTQYKPSRMADHHAPGKHEYLIASRVFWPDVLINVPKLKTHIKAGLTGAMKNLVGINGHKEYLPHHILGSHEEGGDCYDRSSPVRSLYDRLYDEFWESYSGLPKARRVGTHIALEFLWRFSALLTADSTSAGSWSQNETIWRTTLDLNHILYFSERSPRRVITVVDGIVGGQGEGPLTPDPRPAGVLIGGENPAYVDAVAARVLGYNISRIPTVYQALYHRRSRFAGPYLEDYEVNLGGDWKGQVGFREVPVLDFIKPKHWRRAAGSPAAAIGSVR
ncbi:MAG: DUF362 domain-containing protein [Candidatus Sericytochromatia bacterium]|nr:DUF362 domain-containing protein [Candidatus Tanganyikabacteria bacterium]